jgi:hypothetical protein
VTGGATDPITAAELLRGARSVADLGEASLDGEVVRHYRGVTDIAAASDAASGPASEQFAAAMAGDGFTRTRVPFDAYLDENGLLRKVSHRFSFASAGAAAGAAGAAGADAGQGGSPREGVEVASTVMLYGFGTPVEVTMPREGEVYAGTVS